MTREQKLFKGLILADIRAANTALLSKNKADKLLASYHAQQAVEKIIKLKAGILGLNLWGHNIVKLLSECKRAGIYDRLKVPYLINKNAKMYTSWEADCRYYPTTVVNRRSVEAALRVCLEWLNSDETK